MVDNAIRTAPTSPRRPPRRLKQIFCPKHKAQNEPEMAISPPIMDHPMYSVVSPTMISNKQQYQKPIALNSVPPRVSSMAKRTATVHTTTGSTRMSPPHPPRKSTSRPLPAKEDRRHSFHLTTNNASATSVRTAPVASAIVTTTSSSSTSSSSSTTSSSSSSCSSVSTAATSSRFADLGNKRQSRAAASVTAAAAVVAASSMVSPVKSRSTPLRVKTYNVNYDPKAQKERQRKRKELEELIAGGRRGSTVKLTLTPRNIT